MFVFGFLPLLQHPSLFDTSGYLNVNLWHLAASPFIGLCFFLVSAPEVPFFALENWQFWLKCLFSSAEKWHLNKKQRSLFLANNPPKLMDETFVLCVTNFGWVLSYRQNTKNRWPSQENAQKIVFLAEIDRVYGRKSADRTKPHFGVIFFVFLSSFFGNL